MTEQRRIDHVVQFMAKALGCKPAEVNHTLARDLVRAAHRTPTRIKEDAAAELERLFH